MTDAANKKAKITSASTPSSKKARIAVCGAGWWSQGWHLPHLSRHEHAEVAAIVEPSANPRSAISELKSVAALGELYGVPTFRNIDELLASGVALDGVLVATSHSSHYECGSKALAKRLHVMMEKVRSGEEEPTSGGTRMKTPMTTYDSTAHHSPLTTTTTYRPPIVRHLTANDN